MRIRKSIFEIPINLFIYYLSIRLFYLCYKLFDESITRQIAILPVTGAIFRLCFYTSFIVVWVFYPSQRLFKPRFTSHLSIHTPFYPSKCRLLPVIRTILGLARWPRRATTLPVYKTGSGCKIGV